MTDAREPAFKLNRIFVCHSLCEEAAMFCPNCGTKSSAEQRFCRSCGFGLEKTAQSLAEQLPAEMDENLQARKERLERLGMILLSMFGAGILGLILYGIVYKMILVQGRAWEGLGLLALIVMIACGLLSVVLFAKANEAAEASGQRKIREPEKLSHAETTGKLLPETKLEPVPSVTERTTDLLFAEKKKSVKES
jgi:hypothetical protein